MNLPLFNGPTLFSQTLSDFPNTSSKFRPSSIFQADDTNFQGFTDRIGTVLLLVGMRI